MRTQDAGAQPRSAVERAPDPEARHQGRRQQLQPRGRFPNASGLLIGAHRAFARHERHISADSSATTMRPTCQGKQPHQAAVLRASAPGAVRQRDNEQRDEPNPQGIRGEVALQPALATRRSGSRTPRRPARRSLQSGQARRGAACQWRGTYGRRERRKHAAAACGRPDDQRAVGSGEVIWKCWPAGRSDQRSSGCPTRCSAQDEAFNDIREPMRWADRSHRDNQASIASSAPGWRLKSAGTARGELRHAHGGVGLEQPITRTTLAGGVRRAS